MENILEEGTRIKILSIVNWADDDNSSSDRQIWYVYFSHRRVTF